MTKITRCPRCGQEIEGDFCPNCDLHFNQHGVYRTEEDKKRIQLQTLSWLEKKKAEEPESEVEQQFQPDEMDEPFSKEVFNRTVGEVLAEQEEHISATEKALKERLEEDSTDEADNQIVMEETETIAEQKEDDPADFLEAEEPSQEDEIPLSVEAKEQEIADQEAPVIHPENLEEVENDALEDNQAIEDEEISTADAGESTEEEMTEDRDESEDDEQEEIKQEEQQKMDDIPADYVTENIQKPSSVSDDKPEPSKINQKYVMISSIVVIILALVIGSGFTYYQHRKAQLEAATKEQKAIEQKIDALYFDKNQSQGFLATTVTKAKTQSIQDQIDTLAKTKPDQAKTLSDELATVQANQELMDKVNALFVSTKIKQNKVLNPALKANQTIELVEMKNPKTAFDKVINQSIADAKKQASQMQTAKDLMAKIYQNNAPVSTATQKQYKAAKEAVDKIQNTEVKDAYQTQLKAVSDLLKQKAEEEKKKKAAEKAAKEKAAKEAFAKETASERKQAQKITGDTSYDEVSANSSAWNWASGVKDKVINTCIERGYITRNGYVLKKAYVLNGEGYYNLYGTSNQSSLLSGYKDSDLPKYLVTINCKTGWFKGGGSN